MILPIRKYPDPGLRTKTASVEVVDEKTRALIESLKESMYAVPGAGLAANQIGVLKSVFVCDPGEDFRAYVNPEIVWRSDEVLEEEEGCLSLPDDIRLKVPRAAKVRFRATTADGEEVEFEADGLLARVLQHETDHLEGRLIIDRVPPKVRRLALRRITEAALEREGAPGGPQVSRVARRR